MTSYFVSVRFDLPSPIPVNEHEPPVPLRGMANPTGRGRDLSYVLSFVSGVDGRIVALEVTVRFDGEGYTWMQTISGEKVPFLIRESDGVSAHVMPMEAARIAINTAEMLETLVVEHRSKIHQFLENLEEWAKEGRAHSDDGESFAFEPGHHMPKVLIGTRSISGDDPPGLSGDHCRRLQLLLDTREPYWTLWFAGYRAALDARQQHGGVVVQMREATASLETAVEVAVTRTQKWGDEKQYGQETIDQIPAPDLRDALYSLLLTRNLVLHRGRMEYKALRGGEKWKDARSRNGDRPLTPADCHDFAEAVYRAIVWLEAHRTTIAAPKR